MQVVATDAAQDVVVRRLASGDVPEVLNLLRTCLGEGTVPRTEAFWQWKHEENPFGRSPSLVAEAAGKLVGLRTFLRWRWRSGGREVEAVRAVDTVTDPNWRARGIFSRLTRQLMHEVAAEGVGFVFNTPNRSSGRGYRRLGWRTLGHAPLLVRPLSPLAVLRRRVTGDGDCQPDLSKLPEVEELLDDRRLDGLFAELEVGVVGSRLEVPWSRKYLDWRYRRVPGITYHALWSLRPGGEALLILRGRVRRGRREVVIADLLSPPASRSRGAASSLLRQALRKVEADYMVAVGSPGTSERSCFLRAGFVPVPLLGPRLVVRPLASEASEFAPGHLRDWRLSAGCLEVF